MARGLLDSIARNRNMQVMFEKVFEKLQVECKDLKTKIIE